jgi:diaminohydroxyphosphoribosylaminopyrimidine deaminase/5-amino-6-(5-phosphoribosylamino)uracil reductase
MEKHDHSHDEFFMRRALELATLGRGHVSPNPLVGCVIVRDNQIISEGWHHQYGGPHAEVDAVQNLTDKGLVAGSTVYVNLEPCSHFGKTPPCADMLIAHRPAKVVVANLDSNPLVAGNGIKKLRGAGIEVITGILEKEGRLLNQRFFTAMEKGRPYIILKWAQTADGFIARQNHDSKWISNVYARQLVHRWRTEEDAFMIGGRTAAHDNPQLNVRDWTGRNPVRVVIDRYLRLPDTLHLFDGTQRTLCYNVLKHEERPNISFVRLDENDFLVNLLHDLHRQKIQSVVVEGGTTILQLFIERGLWDEARVFTSPQRFGKGVSAPVLNGTLTEQVPVATDLLQRFRPLPV